LKYKKLHSLIPTCQVFRAIPYEQCLSGIPILIIFILSVRGILMLGEMRIINGSPFFAETERHLKIMRL